MWVRLIEEKYMCDSDDYIFNKVRLIEEKYMCDSEDDIFHGGGGALI